MLQVRIFLAPVLLSTLSNALSIESLSQYSTDHFYSVNDGTIGFKAPADLANSKAAGLSLAMIHHPFEDQPLDETVANMIASLAGGDQGIHFDKVTLFYDGQRVGPELQNFLDMADLLQEKGLIHKVVPLRREDPIIKQAMGFNSESGPLIDQAAVAFYQHIFEECTTALCMQVDGDVFAHYGGGVNVAKKLLLQNTDLFMMLPPLIGDTYIADQSQMMEDVELFGTPYPHPILRLPRESHAFPAASLDSCMAARTRGMSTRYFITHRKRFMQSNFLPAKFPDNGIFEQSFTGWNDKIGSVQCGKGSGVGFFVHPPLWSLGTEFAKGCPVKAVQRLVDEPEGLLVDSLNNMIKDSWMNACRDHSGKEP